MVCSYRLTWEQLYDDLYDAYREARKHKASKPYVRCFEENLDENLKELCDELFNRTYKPLPSSCFIITEPKKREVFAAEFRDRVVHHLYYNYTHNIYERTFIHDTYSCIKGRGTHFGIERLQGHIRKESLNYRVPCHVMYGDIRGYFMHIIRIKLLNICMKTLDKMSMHKISKYREERWKDVVDMEFVGYLTCEIVMLNPINGCVLIGSPSEWADLPHNKSLYHSPEGCGLPIGNLTSQLFSNVYLNVMDQYIKRGLKCRGYARYVDDFRIVCRVKVKLLEIVPKIRVFLLVELGLSFHDGKMKIVSVWHGVEFLGAWLKPYRIYASRDTVVRIRIKLRVLARTANIDHWYSALNSYCGVLSHWNNFNLRKKLLNENPEFGKYGMFTMDYRKYHTVRKSEDAAALKTLNRSHRSSQNTITLFCRANRRRSME